MHYLHYVSVTCCYETTLSTASENTPPRQVHTSGADPLPCLPRSERPNILVAVAKSLPGRPYAHDLGPHFVHARSRHPGRTIGTASPPGGRGSSVAGWLARGACPQPCSLKELRYQTSILTSYHIHCSSTQVRLTSANVRLGRADGRSLLAAVTFTQPPPLYG